VKPSLKSYLNETPSVATDSQIQHGFDKLDGKIEALARELAKLTKDNGGDPAEVAKYFVKKYMLFV